MRVGSDRRLTLPLAVRGGLAALILLGMAVLATGCQPPATPTAQAEPGVTVDEVLADPQRFLGQTVAAQANVVQIVNERVIVLQSQLAGGEMAAVLSSQAAEQLRAVRVGEEVRVVGTVEPLTPEEIRQVEEQLGIDLDEQVLMSLAGQAPFIVVQEASR